MHTASYTVLMLMVEFKDNCYFIKSKSNHYTCSYHNYNNPDFGMQNYTTYNSVIDVILVYSI